MSDELVVETRNAHAAGTSVRDLATLHGYPYGTVHSALTGRTYRQSSGPLRTVTGRRPAALLAPELRRYYRRRMQQMVDVSASGCHYFTGPVTAGGYAHVVWAGFEGSVHELAYLLTNGPLPPGHFVSHSCHGVNHRGCPDGSCRHRQCVNARHLQAVRGDLMRGRQPLSLPNQATANNDPPNTGSNSANRDHIRPNPEQVSRWQHEAMPAWQG